MAEHPELALAPLYALGALGPEDRALFSKMPSAEEATLPTEGSFIR